MFQIPSPAPDPCEPEAVPDPVPSEPPHPSTSLNSYYNTALCLPPYTAYDMQVSYFVPQVKVVLILINMIDCYIVSVPLVSKVKDYLAEGYCINIQWMCHSNGFLSSCVGSQHVPWLLRSVRWIPVWREPHVAYDDPSALLASLLPARWEAPSIQPLRHGLGENRGHPPFFCRLKWQLGALLGVIKTFNNQSECKLHLAFPESSRAAKSELRCCVQRHKIGEKRTWVKATDL